MDYKSAILESLDNENKDGCVKLALEALETEKFSIPTLYEEVLKPSLYSFDNCNDDDCIWKEHIRSSIVRTVIECIYPYVIKYKKQAEPSGSSVVLICPEKEYHEIGLRMIDDFFSLNGFETIFIGSNTPKSQVLNAVIKKNPKYLAISVTDYYLLFEAQRMIQNIKNISDSVKIIVGGNAFKANLDLIGEIGGDIYLETYQDIVNLRKGDTDEISF